MPLFVFDFFDKSGIIRRDFEAVMDSDFICSESDNSVLCILTNILFYSSIIPCVTSYRLVLSSIFLNMEF